MFQSGPNQKHTMWYDGPEITDKEEENDVEDMDMGTEVEEEEEEENNARQELHNFPKAIFHYIENETRSKIRYDPDH